MASDTTMYQCDLKAAVEFFCKDLRFAKPENRWQCGRHAHRSSPFRFEPTVEPEAYTTRLCAPPGDRRQPNISNLAKIFQNVK